MPDDFVKRLNDLVISRVSIGIAISKAEECFHSCFFCGVAFLSVVTYKPYVLRSTFELSRDRGVALGDFFRTSVGVEPIAK